MAALIFHLLQFLFFVMISGEQTGVRVFQFPPHKQVKNGESVSINCELSPTEGTLVGAYLKRNLANPIDLIYIHKETANTTMHESYKSRLVYEGIATKFTITLKDLLENDTDIYSCIFGLRLGKVSDQCGQGTMLFVSDPNLEHCADGCIGVDKCKEISYTDPIVIGVIVAAIVAMLCALVLLLWRVKKLCQHDQPQRGRAPNSVYEDMNLVRTQSMAR